MKNSIKVQYVVGKSSLSLEYPIVNFLDFLNKQLHLSIPLITGVKISYKKNKKEYIYRVYVGKEIPLKECSKDRLFLQKYDISLHDLASVAVLGYDRACLLNFKKYDQVIVGIHSEDMVVPDYYALKKVLTHIQDTLVLV